jgi:hypothetical protein
MRIPEGCPQSVRQALDGLKMVETDDSLDEHEDVIREASSFVARFFPADKRAFIASTRTIDAASRYMSLQGTGVVVFDGEEADVLSWLGTMCCRPDREIFFYVQLLITAAQMEIGGGRVDNALTLAQCAHYQLFRFAQSHSGTFRPATREGLARAVLISKLIPRFICGHEIGHHFVRDPRRGARDIATLRDLYTERDEETVPGTSGVLSRTTKPDTEYDIAADGRCTGARTAAIDRLPKPTKWDGYFPEIAADFVGMLFVTEFARETSVPPLLLLEHLSVVFHVMEMRRQIRTLLDTTPVKSLGGGTATFPYSRFAYRASMLAVLACAIADGRLDSTPLAKDYWGPNQRDVERFAAEQRSADIDVVSMQMLDFICRRGFLEAVSQSGTRVHVDGVPGYNHIQGHPIMQGAIDWIDAPLAVPDDKFRFESTYPWIDSPDFQAWSGWACACMDIARMAWDRQALQMICGDDYLRLCAGMSARDLFDTVAIPRWDIVDQAVTFPPRMDEAR